MRRPRNFQTGRCYHLISRVDHRVFCLRRSADISPGGEGQEVSGMKLLHQSYSTNGVRPLPPPREIVTLAIELEVFR